MRPLLFAPIGRTHLNVHPASRPMPPSHTHSIGDDRAEKTRRKYGKPLKAVIVLAAGEVAG